MARNSASGRHWVLLLLREFSLSLFPFFAVGLASELELGVASEASRPRFAGLICVWRERT